MSRLELQKGNTSVDMLDRLAKSLGVPITALLAEPAAGAKAPRPLRNGRKPGARKGG